MRAGKRLRRWVRDALPFDARQRVLERSVLFRQMLTPVRDRAPVTNVFHCSVHKAGSQWVRRLLTDQDVYRYTGLRWYYDPAHRRGGDARPMRERVFPEGFPPERIISPLYITLHNLFDVPKPEDHRAFFVTRDPRDMAVSWYFSMLRSHPENPSVLGARAELRQRTKEEGLLYAVDALEDQFHALRSWVGAEERDARLWVVRFEDLTGANTQWPTVRALMDHCRLSVPDAVLRQVLERYSFRRMTGGRELGEAKTDAHMRSGIHGDWRNHFTDAVARKFAAETGDLIEVLGYA